MKKVTLLETCALNELIAEPYIKDAIAASESNGTLDLSGYSLDEKLCEVISCLLTKSNNISKLKLSDCMISSEGFKPIINSLMHNKNIIEVNFYGNIISSEVAKCLSKLLEENLTIKIMVLNWCNMGQSLEGFSFFCEGLSQNRCLEYLDLRNNMLTSSCGKFLSKALLSNQHLKALDVRWNRLMNEGVGYLQDALLENTVLREISLKVNFVQSQIVCHTEQQVKHNESIEAMKLEYEIKIASILKDLKILEDNRIQEISKITESAHEKIVEMEKIIEETTVKLLNKEDTLQKAEKDKEKIVKEVLYEKEMKVDIMEELEKVKRTNLALRESLKMKEEELQNLSEISRNAIEREIELNKFFDREVKEKNKIIKELQNEIHNQQVDLDNRLKQESVNVEAIWKSRLNSLKDKLQSENESTKFISLHELRCELEDKKQEINSLQINIERVSGEKTKLEEELVKWKTKYNILSKEVGGLKRKLNKAYEDVKNIEQDLDIEKAQHIKTKETVKKQCNEITELNGIIELLKNDLSKEKLNCYDMAKELNEAILRLNIEKEEEKLRSEMLSAALKRYLSKTDGAMIV